MCLSGLLSPPVASISTIPRSSSVCLPINGGESIFHLMITMAVLTVCVWFETNMSASPITGRSSTRAFNSIRPRHLSPDLPPGNPEKMASPNENPHMSK